MRHREVPESASVPAAAVPAAAVPAAAAHGGSCAVEGCDKAPQRSQPRSRVAEALPELALEGGRRVKLCRDHYRAYHRASRETRRLDRMGG